MKAVLWIVTAALMSVAVAKGAERADEPYLWLEDVRGAKALAWVSEQNTRSTDLLKGDPDYQQDYAALLTVLDAPDRIAYGSVNHQYVFNFWQDAKNPKGVWRRTSVADYATPDPHWEVLLDIDKLSSDEKENWVWKGANCSPSLKSCLLRLSRGGGDAVTVREFNLATRTAVPDGLALADAKSVVTWLDDDSVLFGTDFGPGSMTTSGYPRILKQWRRGTPVSAAAVIYEGAPSDVVVWALHYPSIELAIVKREITFYSSEYFFIQPDGSTAKLPVPLDAQLRGAQGGSLIFSIRKSWTPFGGVTITKGSLIAFPVESFLRSRTPKYQVIYVPDARSAIRDVATSRDAVFVSVLRDVVGSVHRLESREDGSWTDTALALPDHGSTRIVSANEWGPEAYVEFQSFTIPPTLYFANAGDPSPIKSLPARFDSSNLVTEQFFADSGDGTKVPYFVTRQKGSSEHPRPTVLYGYGGFEISNTPTYSPQFGKLWLEKGGVWVVANIRGGGEYGPTWHQAALKENRQRAFDDFVAVARDLEERGITTTKQLGIMGRSNGGLLVSTVMTQHPELFGAVVCQVPLIDMIRYTQIGAGASWEDEYGDPAIPEQRAYILKYSPYQNVRKDRRYPPVLFTTATTDDRVTPVHARKMAARMEDQGHDVLFYENTDGGHGGAADYKQAAEMWALSFVYLKLKLELNHL